MADPYVYPGTDILINKERIRDGGELEAFERVMTAARMETLPAGIPLTEAGYRQIHRYIFQDVYDWAGKFRTVGISKGGHMFCMPPYIGTQMKRRFAAIKGESGLTGLSRAHFVRRAAEHISEINAIHPFREGNGRTQRAFLECLGDRAGHRIALQRIDPDAWMDASIRSFRDADYEPMRLVIDLAVVAPDRRRRHPPGGQERTD